MTHLEQLAESDDSLGASTGQLGLQLGHDRVLLHGRLLLDVLVVALGDQILSPGACGTIYSEMCFFVQNHTVRTVIAHQLPSDGRYHLLRVHLGQHLLAIGRFVVQCS